MNPSRKPPESKEARSLVRLAGLGVDLVVSTLVGGTIGWWLDRLTGWSPLFLVVFLVFGAAAGFLAIYRAVAGDDDENMKTGVRRR